MLILFDDYNNKLSKNPYLIHHCFDLHIIGQVISAMNASIVIPDRKAAILAIRTVRASDSEAIEVIRTPFAILSSINLFYRRRIMIRLLDVTCTHSHTLEH